MNQYLSKGLLMSFNECRQKIIDFLGTYQHQISLSNNSGLGNHAKNSEEIYCGLLNILYPSSNYKKPENINEKAIDLYDPIGKIAIQIKSKPRLSPSEIKNCFGKFIETDWFTNKKYDFAILLTTSKCSVKEQEFKVNGYSYFNTEEFYLDNQRLADRLTVNNCQKVLAYLDKAINPKAPNNHVGDTVTNNYGSVVNISNTGDMHFNNAIFDQASDQRQLTIHADNQFPIALKSYQQGFYLEARSKFKQLLAENIDIDVKNDSYFYYILSKLSKVNIYTLSNVEADKISKYLGYLEDTKYRDIADILWLIVYFEKVATTVPSSSIESQMIEKYQRLNYVLPHKYQQLIEQIDVYADSSKELMKLLTYGVD